MDRVRVKICGLSTPSQVAAVASAGADYVGFVFFPKSPRHLEVDTAAALARSVPAGIARVALTVDADNALLDRLLAEVPLEMLQLHGQESPDRVAEIRHRWNLPVMKAVGVADAADLPRIAEYEAVADMILLDAKPPKGADLPGGNGLAFDWRLIAGRGWQRPWMLAGGLTPQTVAEAIRLTGAPAVDVSSGVESAPGVKDVARIAAFVAAARG
ncbi:phosphoribosylanthranilate isomerase [Frigidibacter oleivorans]|uniref:phosphoribosylanthranilate isomerase n=1 Tax=Frigidibacter oleivorans TaxID=2487129 RepID=UPI000F8EB5E1|nr:phosphoribosylanthranilate isomerase [Frigidibacter oleivorans]